MYRTYVRLSRAYHENDREFHTCVYSVTGATCQPGSPVRSPMLSHRLSSRRYRHFAVMEQPKVERFWVPYRHLRTSGSPSKADPIGREEYIEHKNRRIVLRPPTYAGSPTAAIRCTPVARYMVSHRHRHTALFHVLGRTHRDLPTGGTRYSRLPDARLSGGYSGCLLVEEILEVVDYRWIGSTTERHPRTRFSPRGWLRQSWGAVSASQGRQGLGRCPNQARNRRTHLDPCIHRG